MSQAITALSADLSWKANLALRLRSKGEIVRFEEEPVLAALCTCAALEFELGNPNFDRLTPFLGGQRDTEWAVDLVSRGQEIGVRIRRRDGRALRPRHPDLCHLLDPSSLHETGVLGQAVIFPRLVAQTYRKRGVELVVVRDWILRTALHFEPSEALGYLQANLWEVETGIAATQAAMLARGELAFFGTHDIVDHLFGWNAEGFQSLSPLYHQAAAVLALATKTQARSHLLLSYLIGVALDDSAQPKWYGSREHLFAIPFLLEQLERSPVGGGVHSLPESFHQVAHLMRQGGPVQQSLVEFVNDCFRA